MTIIGTLPAAGYLADHHLVAVVVDAVERPPVVLPDAPFAAAERLGEGVRT
jgi:hypothetical protein